MTLLSTPVLTKPLNLVVGPPGSGKTTRLLEVALAAARAGRRVWWVGLPSQRSYIYTRATAQGAVLGLEFMSGQQVYYRLLAAALRLKPLVVGTGRMALVGEALKILSGELPAPGEARLFTRAVAEAKRFGVTPEALPAIDRESRRLREVFGTYERLKGERWDYDDFRREAFVLASLAAAGRETLKLEADLLIVDGFRELGPLETGLYDALSNLLEVWVGLPVVPADLTNVRLEALPPRPPSRTTVLRAANPVAEARWTLRALKKDLAEGVDPLSLAVILPEREVRAFAALADEYGVPLMDETPKALAESPGGRLLLDLLELPDHPTPSRLLALPELVPLANLALKRNLVGREALFILAKEIGLERPLSFWLARLETPQDELEWARDLLQSLPELTKRSPERGWDGFKTHALERAKEAAQLARGAQFRAWWGALLQETATFERPRGGVALLTPNLASGRRFRKVYLLRALEGAYGAGEHEDYFVPEEARVLENAAVTGAPGLPKRFLGRDPLVLEELRTRADETVVLYPEADQNGPRVPEPALTAGARPLTDLPAGSALEAGARAFFRAPQTPVVLRRASVKGLERFDRCGFRFWAERFTEPETVWWRALVRELRGLERLNAARLAALCASYPHAAAWLGDAEGTLTPLTFGYTLEDTFAEPGEGPYAHLDAVGRRGDHYRVYTFVPPERFADEYGQARADARRFVEARERLHELWATAQLLARGAASVELFVWPVLGDPIPVYDAGVVRATRQMNARVKQAAALHGRFAAGEMQPKAGFGCRECGVFDLCRVGKR